MKKLNMFIAALHASAVALSAFPGTGQAQDMAEIRAYMEALADGTPEAMRVFLTAYPQSGLPGSELGARIAAALAMPTAATQPAVRATPEPTTRSTSAMAQATRDVGPLADLY